jgi:hypothetical protein
MLILEILGVLLIIFLACLTIPFLIAVVGFIIALIQELFS